MCNGSNIKQTVSDYGVITRRAICPECKRLVRITIPDRKLNGNLAKFTPHSSRMKNEVASVAGSV